MNIFDLIAGKTLTVTLTPCDSTTIDEAGIERIAHKTNVTERDSDSVKVHRVSYVSAIDECEELEYFELDVLNCDNQLDLLS